MKDRIFTGYAIGSLTWMFIGILFAVIILILMPEPNDFPPAETRPDMQIVSSQAMKAQRDKLEKTA